MSGEINYLNIALLTHQVDDLIDVVHEGDVGLSVRPDEEAGGGGDVVTLVDLGGGEQKGG